MRTEELSTLAIRILAIYVSLYGVQTLSQAVPMWWNQGELSERSLLLVTVLLSGPILLGLLLWSLSAPIGRTVARGLSPTVSLGALDAGSLSIVAFIVVGVVVLVINLPSAVSATIHYISERQGLQLVWMISNVVKCLLGLGLVFGARGLRNILFKLRYAGIKHDDL